MFSNLRFGAVVVALCAPSAAYVVFMALWGGGFGGEAARQMGIDFLLWKFALSLLFVAPPVIWLALMAARHDPAARRLGPGLMALVLMPLALVLAWLIFALVFLGTFPALGAVELPGWVRNVSLTDDVDDFAALLSLGLFIGLYVLSGSVRRLRGLRTYVFLAPCILAPAALTGFWLGLNTSIPIDGQAAFLRTWEIVASDISGHVAPMMRRSALYLLWGYWDGPEYFLGLTQLAGVLLLAVLPVVIALNVLRYPARRPRALIVALIIAWIVHLPSDAILVYSAWYDAMNLINGFAHTLAYGAGPLIRLLAVIGAVALAIRRTASGNGDESLSPPRRKS